MIWYTYKECPRCRCSIAIAESQGKRPEKASEEVIEDEKPRKIPSSGQERRSFPETDLNSEMDEKASFDIAYFLEEYWRYGFAFVISVVVIVVAILSSAAHRGLHLQQFAN
jgi:hypothetical protein